jgi:hypothetical protein
MDNANNIIERKNLDGSIDYIVNIGNLLYNDRIVAISNLVIPFRQQSFFVLPEEKRYYAAINVYYSLDDGEFIFDVVRKSDKYIDSCDSGAQTNIIPIGQFIIQQSLSSFEVKSINFYSKMSTFAITTNFVKGDRGTQGGIGATGFFGATGFLGYTGIQGIVGFTGIQGETCIGMPGYTGIQGATGIYPDTDLQLYLKFKTNDINLTDYSVYERDLLWGSTGAGLTGIVYTGDEYLGTAIELIDQGQSSITLEPGVVDNCHNAQYKGGISGYRNNSYFGFTGIIHTWVNIDQAPISDFIYEALSGMVGYPVRFMNTSLYAPRTLTWDINGSKYNSGIIVHSFGSTGAYLVRLTATNLAGAHTKSELITIA